MSSIVLLHGFAQTAGVWAPVAAALSHARPGAQVAVPEIRGHGAASDERPVSLDAVLDDLDAAVDGHLAGYSMGGRIALAYALARPGRVASLTLISASPGISDPRERTARVTADEALAVRIERDGITAFADEWERLPLWAGQSPAVREAARAQRLGQSAEGLAEALRGLGAGSLPALWDRLCELSMPVSLVVGERDHRYRQIARQMALAVRDARLTVVPGAGHAVGLEAPEAVAEAIDAMLRAG